MAKFEIFILFVVLLKTNVALAFRVKELFHRTNEKVFEILDDLFMALKMDRNITNDQDAKEFISRHAYVQETLCKNHKIYKKIYDVSKTEISHKINFYVTNINEVIDEMINETVKSNVTVPDDNKTHTEDLNDFVNLAKNFNLKIDALTPRVFNVSGNSPAGVGRRIFSGSATGFKRYPFMASVHVDSRFICAGALVHDYLAISAATCLMNAGTSPQTQIRIGSAYVGKMGVLIDIQENIVHPEFDRSTLANNLVLLRAKVAMRYRRQWVAVIAYRTAPKHTPEDENDVIILGWGRRRADDSDLPQEDRPLSQSHLQIYDFDTCKYIYTSEFVSEKTFCAGFTDRGGGACNHDGGGPGVVSNVLAGVISFGSPRCGAADAPTVFTRVDLYAAWIDSVVDMATKISKASPIIPDQTEPLYGEPTDMQDVYRQNINANDVLYGPIEMTPEDYEQHPKKPPKTNLRELPQDPGSFPDLNLPKLPPPKPPRGQLGGQGQSGESKDKVRYSVNAHYHKHGIDNTNKLGARVSDEQPISEACKAIADDQSPKAAEDENNERIDPKNTMFREGKTNFKNNKGIEVQPSFTRISPSYKRSTAKQKAPVNKREEAGGTGELHPVTKSIIPLESIDDEKFDEQLDIDIKNSIDNDKGVIILFDTGTTQKIEMNKNNPIYKRGFKMLAAKYNPKTAPVI